MPAHQGPYMDKQLLRDSLGLVDLPDAGLTVRCYEILFDRYPTIRAMFGRETRVQAHELHTALLSVADHVDDAEWLRTTLHALGRQHARFGVTRPMYCAFAECMIAAMSEIGGDAWTPAMTSAWDSALAAVATIMLDGYPDQSATAPRARRRSAGAA